MTSIETEVSPKDFRGMQHNAHDAAEFLKALAHEGRLMILCHLATGEKSVNELEDLLGARQATVSQHLARLRYSGFVTSRRVGKTVVYSLPEGAVREMISILHGMFCEENART